MYFKKPFFKKEGKLPTKSQTHFWVATHQLRNAGLSHLSQAEESTAGRCNNTGEESRREARRRRRERRKRRREECLKGERGCEERRGSERSEGVRRGEQSLEEGDRGSQLLFCKESRPLTAASSGRLISPPTSDSGSLRSGDDGNDDGELFSKISSAPFMEPYFSEKGPKTSAVAHAGRRAGQRCGYGRNDCRRFGGPLRANIAEHEFRQSVTFPFLLLLLLWKLFSSGNCKSLLANFKQP